MKILHISSEKSWRGGEQQIAYLLDELKEYFENEVVCRKGSAFERFCIDNGIKYHSLSFSGLEMVKSAFQLKSIASDCDLIHAHTSKGHSLCHYALVVGMKKNVVASRRVDFVPKNSFMTKAKYTHKYVRNIVCVSDAIKSIMTNYLGERYAQKCLTIHSGIDVNKLSAQDSLDLRKEYKLTDDTMIIGNTSAIADHKDFFTFIDTAKLLIDEGVRCKFFIIGSGPLEKDIKQYSDQKGLANHVIFTGFVDNPISYLKNFDIFLITSKTEGLGTSIIDAFANDIPVVATKAGGIPELVIHGKTGLLAEIKDAKGLKDNIISLLNDQSLKQNLITDALKHLDNFTKAKTATKTRELYQSLKEIK